MDVQNWFNSLFWMLFQKSAFHLFKHQSKNSEKTDRTTNRGRVARVVGKSKKSFVKGHRPDRNSPQPVEVTACPSSESPGGSAGLERSMPAYPRWRSSKSTLPPKTSGSTNQKMEVSLRILSMTSLGASAIPAAPALALLEFPVSGLLKFPPSGLLALLASGPPPLLAFCCSFFACRARRAMPSDCNSSGPNIKLGSTNIAASPVLRRLRAVGSPGCDSALVPAAGAGSAVDRSRPQRARRQSEEEQMLHPM
mmetsp:Transcript_18720/g.58830  ORF Transcript_18720/g.58830 Transcript_18720/m.58830 type:complete len:252 (+) Transcript_18720:1636-2391(+)